MPLLNMPQPTHRRWTRQHQHFRQEPQQELTVRSTARRLSAGSRSLASLERACSQSCLRNKDARVVTGEATGLAGMHGRSVACKLAPGRPNGLPVADEEQRHLPLQNMPMQQQAEHSRPQQAAAAGTTSDGGHALAGCSS